MANKKVPLNEQALKEANGGISSSKGATKVIRSSEDPVPLNQDPIWHPSLEIMPLTPGVSVYTEGKTAQGTNHKGMPCTSVYICYNGEWGWIDSQYLS